MKKLKIYIIIISSLLICFLILNFVSGYFGDRVELYVEKKATLYATTMIEESLRTSVIPKIDEGDLLEIKEGSDGKVLSVNINTAHVNEILANVNESVSKSIQEIEKVELDLPLGIILSDTLFGNDGPNIAIKITPIGSAKTDVVSKVSPYGINSSLLEISINVKIDIETLIPLRRNSTELNFNIPIIMQIINSEVPPFYLRNND